ncbi:MAG: class I SAM-dependent methyltransferase [Legionellales bacterium]|nr:class I SAM-dependent methyltransferase [Legionellales bacterium]
MIEHQQLLENLRAWSSSTLGKYVHAVEQTQLNHLLPRFFGYYLLQISLQETCFDLSASPIRERIFLNQDNYPPRQAPTLRALGGELPFRDNSIDVVILPHLLEHMAKPDEILREVERVLIPEGHLIIFGFNPYSLWGLTKLWRAHQEELPWSSRFIAPTTLQNWLTAYDFDILRKDFMIYRFPQHADAHFPRMNFIEKLGYKYWPSCGAVYLLFAKKKVLAMRPLRVEWKKPPKLKATSVIETLQQHQDIHYG